MLTIYMINNMFRQMFRNWNTNKQEENKILESKEIKTNIKYKNMNIKVKKLREEAKIPTYGRKGDAGLDMYAMETVMIEPMGICRFDHGFAMEIPDGYVALVKDKGSMAMKGLHTLGGVFDSGYRGEYNSILINLSNRPYMVEEGDKVSQVVIMPFESANIEEVDELTESERGEGRFGSTGK